MSRKPHFLRQLSAVAFIASALLMPDKGLSQVLSSAGAENNNYFLSTPQSDATNSEYGQKVVRNNPKQSVILTRLNTGGCRFVLIDKEQQMMKYADMPTEYLINDFDLLRDTIYFGGRHYVSGDTLSKGFIGYISVPDLFFTPQVQCTYTDIPSLTNVQRVIAYNDSTNESIVAAMASQYYADVYYEPEPLHEFDSTINGPILPPPDLNYPYRMVEGEGNTVSPNSMYDDLGMGWRNDTLWHWDCFAALRIKREATSTSHRYDIWRLNHRRGFEIARDMCMTKDYICLVVSYYNRYEYCIPFNQFYIYRIDKNNFANHINNLMIASNFAAYDGYDLLKTTCVGGNNITLCYTANSNNSNGNALYKINLDTNPYYASLSHYMDAGCPNKPRVWDMEYIKEQNVLLVLKEDGEKYNYPTIWYMSMNTNTLMPYNAKVLDLPASAFGRNGDSFTSSISKHNKGYLTIVGSIDDLTLTEKKTFGFFSGNACNTITERRIIQDYEPTFSEKPGMEHCRFIYMTGTGINMRVKVRDLPANADIQNFAPLLREKGEINKVCTNKEENMIYEPPQEIK